MIAYLGANSNADVLKYNSTSIPSSIKRMEDMLIKKEVNSSNATPSEIELILGKARNKFPVSIGEKEIFLKYLDAHPLTPEPVPIQVTPRKFEDMLKEASKPSTLNPWAEKPKNDEGYRGIGGKFRWVMDHFKIINPPKNPAFGYK